MTKKHFLNYKIVTLEINQVVILCITKENHIIINNYWFLYIIKEIPYKG